MGLRRRCGTVCLGALLAVQPAVLVALRPCCANMPAGATAADTCPMGDECPMHDGKECPMHHGADEGPYAAPHRTASSRNAAPAESRETGDSTDTSCLLRCGSPHDDDPPAYQTPRGLMPLVVATPSPDRFVPAPLAGDPGALSLAAPPLSPPPRA